MRVEILIPKARLHSLSKFMFDSLKQIEISGSNCVGNRFYPMARNTSGKNEVTGNLTIFDHLFDYIQRWTDGKTDGSTERAVTRIFKKKTI